MIKLDNRACSGRSGFFSATRAEVIITRADPDLLTLRVMSRRVDAWTLRSVKGTDRKVWVQEQAPILVTTNIREAEQLIMEYERAIVRQRAGTVDKEPDEPPNPA